MHTQDVPVRRRGCRAGGAGGRHLARPARRGDDARRAPGRAVLAAPRDRGEPALDGAAAPRGASRTRSARARSTSSGAGGSRTPWRRRRAGSAWPVGLPTREQAAVLSPTAPACVPQDHLEPVLLEHLRSLGGTRVHLHTEVVGVEDRAEGVEVVLRDCASGDVRTVRARYLVAADGAHSRIRTALGIAMRGPDGLGHVVTALFRAPLWAVLGEHRYGIYSVGRPARRRAPSCPPAAATAGSTAPGCDAGGGPGATRRSASCAGSAPGAGIGDLDVSIERTGAFTLRRPAGRPLPRRERLPRRRRRPPRDPARRHRDEHRDPRRPRPGLEARLGAARLGRARAARQLRGRAAAGRRPQRRPVRRSRTAPCATPPTSCTWTSAGASRTSGSAPAAGACPRSTSSAPGSRCSPGPTAGPGRRGRPAGRRSPSAAWTPRARAIGIRGRGALLVRPDGAPARLWAQEASAAA